MLVVEYRNNKNIVMCSFLFYRDFQYILNNKPAFLYDNVTALEL